MSDFDIDFGDVDFDDVSFDDVSFDDVDFSGVDFSDINFGEEEEEETSEKDEEKEECCESVFCKGCNTEQCFNCGEPTAHNPATCDMVRKWNKKSKENDSDEVWMKNNTKACPRCNTKVRLLFLNILLSLFSSITSLYF